jgi:hypothetical protein
MPQGMRNWRWNDMKLVTFGAPPVGGDQFSRVFSIRSPGSKNISVDADPIPKTKGTQHGLQVILYSASTVSGDMHAPDAIRERLVGRYESFGFDDDKPDRVPWQSDKTKRIIEKLGGKIVIRKDRHRQSLIDYLDCIARSRAEGVKEVSKDDLKRIALASQLLGAAALSEDRAKKIYADYFSKADFRTRSFKAMLRFWLGLAVLESGTPLSAGFIDWIEDPKT